MERSVRSPLCIKVAEIYAIQHYVAFREWHTDVPFSSRLVLELFSLNFKYILPVFSS